MINKVTHRIIGIDPGYAITGYGIIEKTGSKIRAIEYGAIETSSKSDFTLRLLAINDKVRLLIEQFKPDCMVIEQLFMGQNHTTAIGTAQARGVVLVEAARAGIDAYEFTPMQVKLAVTGYGKAEKKQVQMMTQRMLGLEEIPKPDDAADALAIAICLANTGINNANKVVSGYQHGRYGYSKRNEFG